MQLDNRAIEIQKENHINIETRKDNMTYLII